MNVAANTLLPNGGTSTVTRAHTNVASHSNTPLFSGRRLSTQESFREMQQLDPRLHIGAAQSAPPTHAEVPKVAVSCEKDGGSTAAVVLLESEDAYPENSPAPSDLGLEYHAKGKGKARAHEYGAGHELQGRSSDGSPGEYSEAIRP